jgi:UDPglucose 6-dehydrogenase
MRVAVIGTGYVGLVTGTGLSEIGHEVICVDIDEPKIAKLKKGESPIYEPGLSELLAKNLEAGRLSFTNNLGDINGAEVIFLALPTPSASDGQADLSFILEAAKEIAKHLKNYTVLVNKSTVPVGTAKKVRGIVASQTSQSLDVVSNPEFLREGHAVEDFLHPDRIVVGTSSEKARKVMQDLYKPLTDAGTPLITMDEASAEMTKYAANSFLVTKISFMNEIANLCELVGADVDKVREGIGSDERIGPRFLLAGIGYGGSCFPKDILALKRVAESHDYDFRMLNTVMKVNEDQKKRFLDKVLAYFEEGIKGKTIAIWGLAFKPETDDMREAPSVEIINSLLDHGASVQVYDPAALENARRVFAWKPVVYAEGADRALERADALLILTEWDEFVKFDPKKLANIMEGKAIFDGRNIFRPEVFAGNGVSYVSVGREIIERDVNK